MSDTLIGRAFVVYLVCFISLCTYITSRTPPNYCTAADVVVSTRIPMCLKRSDLTSDSPSMHDHLYDTLRRNWLVFLIEVTTLGRIHTLAIIPFYWRKQKKCRIINPQMNYRHKLRSGTKNGAIPREGACNRPAKREACGRQGTSGGHPRVSYRDMDLGL